MGSRSLIISDLDGTLIKGDSFLLFLWFSSNSWAYFIFRSILAIPVLVFWKAGFISTTAAKEKILRSFTGKRKQKELFEIGTAFSEKVLEGKLRPYILDKLREINNAGGTSLIVSASPEIWVQPLGELIGAASISTRLEFKNGRFTGKFEGENCQGVEKVRRIKEVVNLKEFDEILVFGNSKGDIPMLELGTQTWYKDFPKDSSSL